MLGAIGRIFGLESTQVDPVPIPTLPSFPGFVDAIFFTPVIQPPPPGVPPYFYNCKTKSPIYSPDFPNNTIITDEQVQEALHGFVEQNCCFGSPNKIHIQDIQMQNSYRYQLVTMTETRQTIWEAEPFINQPINPSSSVRILGPWEYKISPTKPFKPHGIEVRLPGTSSIRSCYICAGNGRVRCTSCDGHGGSRCHSCSGNSFDVRRCSFCHGTGRRRCSTCSGHGLTTCSNCKGKGQLYLYLKLIVQWKPTAAVYASYHPLLAMPIKQIVNEVKGKHIVKDQNKIISPLTNFPHPGINATSENLISTTLENASTAHKYKIIEMKQTVEIIRLAEITYTYKEETDVGKFHVIGEFNKVYFPDYPETCSCICSIV